MQELLAGILPSDRFFGPLDWENYFGLEISLGLPPDMTDLKAILNQDCPFVPGKKVSETHYLFCLPNNFSAKNLSALRTNWSSSSENQIKFSLYPDVVKRSATRCEAPDSFKINNFNAQSNWYLAFKGFVPGYEEKTWSQQVEGIYYNRDFENPKFIYEIPKAIEVIPMFFMVYVKNGKIIESCGYGRTSDQYNSYFKNFGYKESRHDYKEGSIPAHAAVGFFTGGTICVSNSGQDTLAGSGLSVFAHRRIVN